MLPTALKETPLPSNRLQKRAGVVCRIAMLVRKQWDKFIKKASAQSSKADDTGKRSDEANAVTAEEPTGDETTTTQAQRTPSCSEQPVQLAIPGVNLREQPLDPRVANTINASVFPAVAPTDGTAQDDTTARLQATEDHALSQAPSNVSVSTSTGESFRMPSLLFDEDLDEAPTSLTSTESTFDGSVIIPHRISATNLAAFSRKPVVLYNLPQSEDMSKQTLTAAV